MCCVCSTNLCTWGVLRPFLSVHVDPADYNGAGIVVLTFDSMTDEIWLDIPIVDDDLCEDNETIDLMLTTSNPDVNLLPATGDIIIVDDDGNVLVVREREWGFTIGSHMPKTILVLEDPRQND